MPDASEATAPSTRVIHAVFDFLHDRRAVLLSTLAAAVVAAALLSGVYIVKKEEQGVLTRFGKVVDPEVPPGIHYALPLVEQAHVRKVMRITSRNIATRDQTGMVSFSILSGDANLFEADVVLQYRIGNLRNFLYATVDPESVLTVIVREHLIDLMSRNFIDLIFTNNRDIIQDRLFRDTSDYLKANDIGVDLLALKIVDLRPIEETVAAFRDVSDAIAESRQMVSDANRRMEKLLARSRGQAEAVVLNAKSMAKERRLQAESSAGVFSDLLTAYRGQPSSVTVTRYWQRMRGIFRDATLSAVNPGDALEIDINMVEGFVPGVARMPAPTVAEAPVERATLTGARNSLSTASEQGVHGFENVDADRFLVEGRLHTTRGERDHMSTARLRSLIFDDLSIFSHRHVAPASVGAAAERNEKPLVSRTAVIPDEDDGDHTEQPEKMKLAGKKSADSKHTQSVINTEAKPEKADVPTEDGGEER